MTTFQNLSFGDMFSFKGKLYVKSLSPDGDAKNSLGAILIYSPQNQERTLETVNVHWKEPVNFVCHMGDLMRKFWP